MKSEKTLESFIQYCRDNPEQRFWQALRNWSGYPAIMTGKPITTISGFGYEGDLDTFYWEGKRHDRKES